MPAPGPAEECCAVLVADLRHNALTRELFEAARGACIGALRALLLELAVSGSGARVGCVVVGSQEVEVVHSPQELRPTGAAQLLSVITDRYSAAEPLPPRRRDKISGDSDGDGLAEHAIGVALSLLLSAQQHPGERSSGRRPRRRRRILVLSHGLWLPDGEGYTELTQQADALRIPIAHVAVTVGEGPASPDPPPVAVRPGPKAEAELCEALREGLGDSIPPVGLLPVALTLSGTGSPPLLLSAVPAAAPPRFRSALLCRCHSAPVDPQAAAECGVLSAARCRHTGLSLGRQGLREALLLGGGGACLNPSAAGAGCMPLSPLPQGGVQLAAGARVAAAQIPAELIAGPAVILLPSPGSDASNRARCAALGGALSERGEALHVPCAADLCRGMHLCPTRTAVAILPYGGHGLAAVPLSAPQAAAGGLRPHPRVLPIAPDVQQAAAEFLVGPACDLSELCDHRAALRDAEQAAVTALRQRHLREQQQQQPLLQPPAPGACGQPPGGGGIAAAPAGCRPQGQPGARPQPPQQRGALQQLQRAGRGFAPQQQRQQQPAAVPQQRAPCQHQRPARQGPPPRRSPPQQQWPRPAPHPAQPLQYPQLVGLGEGELPPRGNAGPPALRGRFAPPPGEAQQGRRPPQQPEPQPLRRGSSGLGAPVAESAADFVLAAAARRRRVTPISVAAAVLLPQCP
eukprot:TRINITY_DN3305_c2_g1_i4.p1 TRINITY_DN3305_c2_g1~~TRINITY_DN3305_c2_g1_i4.p1  ORF type:complete len:729 (+),score=176.64 TRINITY_DN3305_c2_g1_i4:122-2188(+)